MAEAFIIDACRTPRGIGKVGKGSLAHLHPQHLAATVLGQIAERIGFCDQGSFSRAYRRTFRHTPSEYRRLAR